MRSPPARAFARRPGIDAGRFARADGRRVPRVASRVALSLVDQLMQASVR